MTRSASTALQASEPPPPALLRRLAYRVERLCAFGRRDPEQLLVDLEAIAHAFAGRRVSWRRGDDTGGSGASISTARRDPTGRGHFFARNGVLPLRKSAIGPPKRLSAEACKSWQKVVDEYQIVDDTGLIILTTAFEAFDRMRVAQDQIKREGMTSVDRFGQVKAHPLLTVERDARTQFLAALKQLNLDIEPLADRPGRPDGGAKQVVQFPGARR